MCQAALCPLHVNLKSINLIFLEWHWCGGGGVNLWNITLRNRTKCLVDFSVNPPSHKCQKQSSFCSFEKHAACTNNSFPFSTTRQVLLIIKPNPKYSTLGLGLVQKLACNMCRHKSLVRPHLTQQSLNH